MLAPKIGRLSPRIKAFLIILVLLAIAIWGRLVWIQLVQAPSLNKISSASRSIPKVLPATRGRILDRNGNVLAESVTRYTLAVDQSLVRKTSSVTVDPKSKPQQWTLDQVEQKIVQITGANLADVQKALGAGRDSDFGVLKKGETNNATVVTGITPDQYNQLKDLNISWFTFRTTSQRVYPSGAVAGNLIGYVGADNNPLAGLELSWNKCLSGQDGEETYERGGDGTPIPETVQTVKPKVDGQDVQLTIDRDLQWFVQQKVADKQKEQGADWVSATVLDAKTGDILAAGESPSVDPNNISATPAADRGSRIFQATYEPGSVIKTVTMAAALEHSDVKPESPFTIPPQAEVPGTQYVIKDAEDHGTIHLTSTGILMESSNIGIMQVGNKVSDQTRYQYLQRFGIGEKTAVNFPGESAGILHNYKNWDAVTHYTSMFGQGLTATPIQVASLYQGVANNGERISPRLVESCKSEDTGKVTENPRAKPLQVVQADTAKTLRAMEEPLFTQYTGKAAQIPGYSLSGKTGTSQTATAGGYSKTEFVTSVVAMAPAQDPQYVVEITISNPKVDKMSTNTMSLLHDLMSQVLISNDVPPSTSNLPDYKPTW